MLRFTTGEAWDLNCYVIIGSQRAYLIDTGRGMDDARALDDAVRTLTALPLTVINTHYHWDHIWGNALFADRPILAHYACRELCVADYALSMANPAVHPGGEAPLLPPNVLVCGELRFPCDAVRIFPVRGHTRDGLCVLDEEDGVLYAGDNVGDAPESPLPELEDSPEQYALSLDAMERFPFALIASGHNLPMPRSFIERIRAELSQRHG